MKVVLHNGKIGLLHKNVIYMNMRQALEPFKTPGTSQQCHGSWLMVTSGMHRGKTLDEI